MKKNFIIFISLITTSFSSFGQVNANLICYQEKSFLNGDIASIRNAGGFGMPADGRGSFKITLNGQNGFMAAPTKSYGLIYEKTVDAARNQKIHFYRVSPEDSFFKLITIIVSSDGKEKFMSQVTPNYSFTGGCKGN